MNIEQQGRSADHPAEIAKRNSGANAGRASLRGFFNPAEKHGEPKLIFGCAEKFAKDLKRYKAKLERGYNPGSATRYWIEAHS